MSDPQNWLAFVAPAAGAVSVVLLLLGIARLKSEQPAQEQNWRDRAPLMFRIARPLVNLFAHRVAESMSAQVRVLLTDRLSAAGLSYSVRPEEFVVSQRIGFCGGVAMFLGAYWLLELDGGVLLYALMFFPPLGYWFPRIWLKDMIKRRHRTIEKQLPFFLDILVLAIRSGLNFSSAVAHSVAKMPTGPIKDEFARVLREMRTGVNRRQALQDLAARIDLAALSNFVAAVNQAEDTGGELGSALTAQAAQRRTERFLHAEKLANQAPMKLLLPLVALLFPISLIIIAFPLVVRARDSGMLHMLFN